MISRYSAPNARPYTIHSRRTVVESPRPPHRRAARRRSSDLTGPVAHGLVDCRPEGSITDSRWCLFLDVDGTLLELAAAPPEVRVEPALIDLLSRVRRALDGAVAFVSGRSIADLDRLFAPVSWPAAGVHGLERRDASGHLKAASSVQAAVIGRARDRLQHVAAELPGTSVEDKGLAVALHYRQAPQFETPARKAAQAIAREVGGDLRLLEGQMVFELLPSGATKSDAIRAFLREAPFCGRRPIFIGDDVTDEQALVDVERMGGLSVAVGDRVGAMLRVASPRDVRVFLEDLADSGVPAA